MYSSSGRMATPEDTSGFRSGLYDHRGYNPNRSNTSPLKVRRTISISAARKSIGLPKSYGLPGIGTAYMPPPGRVSVRKASGTGPACQPGVVQVRPELRALHCRAPSWVKRSVVWIRGKLANRSSLSAFLSSPLNVIARYLRHNVLAERRVVFSLELEARELLFGRLDWNSAPHLFLK